MIFFSFGGKAFNKEYCETNIYIIIASKKDFNSQIDFLNRSIAFVNDKVYPGEEFASDYEEMSLKEGEYEEIVERWIDSMNNQIEIKFDEIKGIKRIKCNNYDPHRDEYLIETDCEYIMFLWSTTA